MSLLQRLLFTTLFLHSILTAPGQTLLKDVGPGYAGSNPALLINVNGTLFFTADDGVHGRELWKSDGTAAGTVLIKDINPGPKGSEIQEVVVANGLLFFSAYSTANNSNTRQLWRSDGTEAGTFQPYDGHKDGEVQRPTSLTRMGNQVFYVTRSSLGGYDGWFLSKSDGSNLVNGKPGGTGACANPSTYPSKYVSQPPTNLTDVNGTLFFTYNGFLWKATGQPTAPNFTLTNIKAFPSFGRLCAYQNKLFFSVGPELWSSDGTAANTQKIISTGTDPIVSLTPAGGSLYVVAGPGARALWTSGGTAATTKQQALLPNAIRALVRPASPVQFVPPKPSNLIYFMAGDEIYRLRISDGALTKLPGSYPGVTNFVQMSGSLYFITSTGLWRLDGSTDAVSAVFNVPTSFTTFSLTEVGKRLYLSTLLPSWGQEVYYVNTP